MIDRTLIKTIGPAAPNIGDQIHVNHIGCSAGEDKKRRLYIKRTSSGLVAYCHHCNEAGFASDYGSRLSTWLTLKDELLFELNKPPALRWIEPAASMWLYSYHILPNNTFFNGVVDQPHQVALTLFNPNNEVIGWQVRNLKPGATPKYITTYTREFDKGESAWFKSAGSALFITEDYLSAYRINSQTSNSSVALLRTTLTDRTLLQIYDFNFDHIFIWLDPDEAGMKGAARVEKDLKHFLPTTTNIKVINVGKEPKECSPSELNKIILEL